MRQLSLICFFCLLLAGCLSHTQHGVSSNLVSYLYPDGTRPDHSRDQVPHLNLPLRVGVAFIPESRHDYQFSLSETEKFQLLEKVAAKFKARPYVQSIEIIPQIYLRQAKGFQTVQQVAALHDVDVMALVSYDQLASTEENILSLGYWTIVGAYILPGEKTESQTFVDTAVFDVKTQKLLFRAPGSAIDSGFHAAVGQNGSKRDIRMKTFTEAFDKMVFNLDGSLESFRTRVKEEKIATVSYRSPSYGGGGSAAWFGVIVLGLLVVFSRPAAGKKPH